MKKSFRISNALVGYELVRNDMIQQEIDTRSFWTRILYRDDDPCIIAGDDQETDEEILEPDIYTLGHSAGDAIDDDLLRDLANIPGNKL